MSFNIKNIFQSLKGSSDKTLETTEDKENKLKGRALAVIVIILFIVVFGSVVWNMVFVFSGSPKNPSFHVKDEPIPNKGGKNASVNTIIPGEKLAQDWKGVVDKQISDTNKKIDDAKKETDDKLSQILAELKQTKEAAKTELPKTLLPTPKKAEAHKPAPPLPQAPLPEPLARNQQPLQPASKPLAPAMQQVQPVVQPSFKHFDFSTDKKSSKAGGIYLPMGFAVGVALNGMDAPTLQWGQQDPQPLVAYIESDLVTANNKSINIVGCMALASGHGSVSAERALLTIVKMECHDKSGNLYSGKVDGYILGDDGKVGMKGILVSRQGAVMAKAFIAGVLDGVGSILRQQYTTTSLSPLGATQTINGSQAAQAGLGQGISNAASQLSSFYIKLAEQMYPIVEILPGRKITAFFKGGSTLAKVDTKNPAEDIPEHPKQNQPVGVPKLPGQQSVGQQIIGQRTPQMSASPFAGGMGTTNVVD